MVSEDITGKRLDVRRFFNQELQDLRQMAQTPAYALVGGGRETDPCPVVTTRGDSWPLYKNITLCDVKFHPEQEYQMLVHKSASEGNEAYLLAREIEIIKHIQKQEANKRTHIIESIVAKECALDTSCTKLYMECGIYGDAFDLFWKIQAKSEIKEKKATCVSCQSFYINQMMASVCQLHDLGVAHLDLKPENFVVMHDGSLKLIDFGSSELQKSHPLHIELPAYCCTRGYDAPETGDFPCPLNKFAFEDLKKIDYWALGAIIAFDLMGFTTRITDVSNSVSRRHHNIYNATQLRSISFSEGGWERFTKCLRGCSKISSPRVIERVIKQLIETLVAQNNTRGSEIPEFCIEMQDENYKIEKLSSAVFESQQPITSSMTLNSETWNAWIQEFDLTRIYTFE